MGLFDQVKKQAAELSVISTLKGLGVDTDNINAYKDGAITYISGSVSSTSDLEKIKKEFAGLLGGITTKIDVDVEHRYTIVDGDSPWGVAQKFYGDGSKFPILVEINNGKDAYYTGDVITIPSLRTYVGGMKLQVILSTIGHNPGPIDGVLGGKTTQAIKEFQKANDLSPNGTLDDNTNKSLRAAFREVQKLDGLALQFVLKDIGAKVGALDGVVGPQTINALKQVQKDNGLNESGAVDDSTLRVLVSKFV